MTLPQLPTLWAMQPEALAALADTLSQDAEGRAARPRRRKRRKPSPTRWRTGWPSSPCREP